MKFLLLSTDEYSSQFDKRIVDLADLLTDLGHSASIITVGKHSLYRSIGSNKIDIFQLQRTYFPGAEEVMKKVGRSESDRLTPNQSVFNLDSFTLHSSVIGRTSRTRFLKDLVKRVVPKRYWPLLMFCQRILDAQTEILRGLVHGMRHSNRLDFYELDALSLVLGVRCDSTDVLVGCDLPGAIAASKLRMPNQQLWYDAHEFFSEQEWVKNVVNLPNLKLWEEFVISECDVMTTVSDGLVQCFRERFPFLGARVHLLSNASSPTRLDSEDPVINLRLTLGLPENAKIIIFHGVLSGKYRNLDLLAKLFTKCAPSEWHLVYMGYSASDFQLTLSEESHNFHLVNPVPNTQVGAILKQVNLIVMPYAALDLNSTHGFPNKLGDAIQLQIPILVHQELLDLAKITNEFHIGVVFQFQDLVSSTLELKHLLEKAVHLAPDWEGAERSYGWTSFQFRVSQLVDSL